jgi:hypothetical protein
MPIGDLNPYESPRSSGDAPGLSAGSVLLRRFAQVLTMGICGYIAFAIVGLAYWAVLLNYDQSVSIGWVLAIGVLGAVIFSVSELFNSGRGKEAGVLRRILITTGTFLLSAVVVALMSALLGLGPQTYDSDPWEPARYMLFAITLIGALYATRLVWIGHH